MKCPICHQEMEQGFLQGNKRVAWVKKKHKLSLLPKEGEVLLANKTMQEFIFSAWICKTCKKVVIDYSNQEYQERS